MLDTGNWQEFRLGSLLDSISKAKSYSKDALDTCSPRENFAIPYVTRTDENNGVESFAMNNVPSGIEPGNALVIGDTTSTVSYQPDDFVAGEHIVILRASWLNVLTGLFMVSLLQKERFRYSYGRAFIMPLIADTSVRLPAIANTNGVPVPDWAWVENFMSQYYHGPLASAVRSPRAVLPVDTWGEFRIGDLFNVKKGRRLTSDEQTEGDNLYIGAIESNNGVAAHIGQFPIHDGNTISLSYNGSIGEAFYQPDPFWATDDVNVLYLRPKYGFKMNKFVGLFICTILRQEKYRYAYGRKWTLDSMNETIIKLPCRIDSKGIQVPNWGWMEQYIKSLAYSDLL